jgi:hypothetical protein
MKWIISNEFDAFDFDDTTYSLEDFYTKSVDSRGHREMTRVAFPPNVLSTLSTIVQSGKIPAYRTVQDVIRDAVLHRIWWLEKYALKESYGIIDYASLKMMKLQQFIENSLKEGQRMEAIVTNAEKALEYHKSLRDKEEMIKVLSELRNQIDNVREPFKDRLKNIIERYEYLEKES